MNRLSPTTLQHGALVLLSVALVYLLSEVITLSRAVDALPSSDQLETLQLQLDRLDAEVNDPKQPGFVTVDDFEQSQLTITERLDTLDQAREHSDSTEQLQEELSALSTDVMRVKAQLLRLEMEIENRATTLPNPVIPRLKKPVSTPPKPASLPFNILGMDSRGGELFLVVATFDVSHLADVVLMRPSTSLMGWRLYSLVADEARFNRPDGSSHIVTIK